MSIETFINIIVILLLVPTIIFALLLNKRLKVLRNSKADLSRLIEAFNDATSKAEAGIPRLKQAVDGAGGDLKEQIRRAQNLHDDLKYLLERAEQTLAQFEEKKSYMNSVANVASAYKPQKQEPTFVRQPIAEPKKVEKRPLFDSSSVRGREDRRPLMRTDENLSDEDLISNAVLAAQDILKDVDAKKEKMMSMQNIDDVEERSETERELLKALQSMR